MKETSQAIAEVKQEVQIVEWQHQIQERQESGMTVDEWCGNLGISKSTYYHRLKRVREYLCQRIGAIDDSTAREVPPAAVVPIRTAQSKAAMEIQLGELQIKFNGNPDAEQLKVILTALMGASKPVC